MRYGVVTLVFFAVVAGVFSIRPAGAVKAFLEQFKTLYVKPKTTDHTILVFNAAVEKKGCNICHHGKSKKNFNAYGEQLKKLLTKNDAQNTQKVVGALKKVGTMKSVPNDPSSPTYVQRIVKGRLPVGEIYVRSKDDPGDNPGK